jgi:hypothetical protein
MKTNARTLFRTLVLTCLLLIPISAHCFYNPSTGRWLSRDPVEEDGGLNLYLFAQNEPVLHADADGRCTCIIKLHCVRGTVLTWIDGSSTVGGVTITHGRDIANYDCTVLRQSGCCPVDIVGQPGGTQQKAAHWVQVTPPGTRIGPNLPPDYDTHKCLHIPGSPEG